LWLGYRLDVEDVLVDVEAALARFENTIPLTVDDLGVMWQACLARGITPADWLREHYELGRGELFVVRLDG
jgi:hypothetical protein